MITYELMHSISYMIIVIESGPFGWEKH